MWPIDAGPPEPNWGDPDFLAAFSRSTMVLMPAFGFAITTHGAEPISAMWVKSATGSYGTFSSANGPIEIGVEFDSISVEPSAGDWTTFVPPTLPPAPGLLWTMTGWPSFLASCSPTIRATMSLAPPAAKVTTMRIGLSAAHAGQASAAAPAAPAR